MSPDNPTSPTSMHGAPMLADYPAGGAPPLIVLDVQHQLRTGIHAHDQGARFGIVTEVELANRYAFAAASRLVTRGYRVYTNVPGWPPRLDLSVVGTLGVPKLAGSYAERAELVADMGVAVYIACHINAGGGSYSLAEVVCDDGVIVGAFGGRPDSAANIVTVDARSVAFAATLMNEMSTAPAGIRGSEVKRFSGLGLRYRGTGSNPLRFERGRGCISRAVELGIPAVLFEPYFGDNPSHAWMQDGQFVAVAITNAVLTSFPLPRATQTVGEILAASRPANGNGP
jgi:hypothetical protein